MENILINKNGEFFHIDFGNILGKQAKYLEPEIALATKLIEGMGEIGNNYEILTENKKKFETEFLETYKLIRKENKLMLNLFLLMVDSGLEMTEEGLIKMSDRFYMMLTDE